MSVDLYLSRLEAQVDIPYPARRELLDEIRVHLQALSEEAIAEGCSASEAIERAIKTFAVDEGFIASLTTLHATAIQRALARLPRSVALGLEYSAVTSVAAILIVFLCVMEAAMLEFMRDGGHFMVLLNLLGVVILILGVERVYSLFLKKDHAPANLGKRLQSLKYMGLASVMLGVIGTGMGLFMAFGAQPAMEGPFPIYEVMRISLTTTIWGLTMGLLALSFHFVVAAKSQRIQAMQGL